MKIICSKEDLANGINIVQKAVSSKTTLPILEGILLEAGDEFKMTGNDLEIGIECMVNADIREKGSIVLNSKMFGEIIRKLPEAEVLLEVKEQGLVLIECENSRFEIRGLSPSGFPAIPSVERENAFIISQKMIREMVRQTIFAVSMDENRPILTGALVECKDGELTIVAIDGFRLALRKSMPGEGATELNVVVPGKTLSEIIKIMQPVDEKISIYSSGNQILFDMGTCKVVSRLLEGEYLNYKGIIPKEHETKFRVNIKEMLSSIERASLVITSEERRYPVRFNLSDDMLVINSNTDAGMVREEIRGEMSGGKMEIGFNPRYFIEALRAIDDERADIYFTSGVGPCTIRPVDGDDYAYMILPVRR